jgi:hypothetical protein
MREDIECRCFFCQGFPRNFTQEEIHRAARELAASQRAEED